MAAIGANPGYNYRQLSASANVKASDGMIAGIFVSAASSTPTITVYESATTTTTKTIVAVFTPVAGTFYQLPFMFTDGLYVVISGTVQATVAWL